MPAEPSSRSLPLSSFLDAEERACALTELEGETLVFTAAERAFLAESGARLRVPFLLTAPHEGEVLADWLERLDLPGLHSLVLLRAGACAVSLWDDQKLLRSKIFKRYVVRGTGWAQGTHLKTKGKSRYGSRLRLQNAARLLEESTERLRDFEEELAEVGAGSPQRRFYSCAVRLWAEVWHLEPSFPGNRDEYEKIPIDPREPCQEELLRVHRALSTGRLLLPDEA